LRHKYDDLKQHFPKLIVMPFWSYLLFGHLDKFSNVFVAESFMCFATFKRNQNDTSSSIFIF